MIEHPHAIEINRRLSQAEEEEIHAMVIFQGMPQMPGTVQKAKTPGLYIFRSNVQLGNEGRQGIMGFCFTPDKIVTISYPDLVEPASEPRIVTPH